MKASLQNFYNVLYVRSHNTFGKDSTPASLSEGGVSDLGIYFRNLEGNLIFRHCWEIIELQAVAVGGVIPFRDINYIILAIKKTEDPEDGFSLLHTVMAYHGMASLVKKGVKERKMEYQTALNMKSIFDKYVCHGKGKDYKKHLHNWLTVQQQKTLRMESTWKVN